MDTEALVFVGIAAIFAYLYMESRKLRWEKEENKRKLEYKD